MLINIKALFLGFIQGATEFLPISSSGHLVLFQHLITFNLDPLLFDIFLHLGTLIAVLIFYRQDILKLVKNFKLVTYLVIATIPAVIVGFTLNDFIKACFSNNLFIGCAYLFTASWLYLGQQKLKKEKLTVNINWKIALGIGIAQAIAITPGISRSGATIVMGLLFKLERKEAAKFSFLLSIPAILGATVLESLKISELNIPLSVLLLGLLAAAVTGYFAIKLLLKSLTTGKLIIFSVYCLVLGIIIISIFR